MICEVKINPKIEPKFHRELIEDGEGRSINILFTIFKILSDLNFDFFIR